MGRPFTSSFEGDAVHQLSLAQWRWGNLLQKGDRECHVDIVFWGGRQSDEAQCGNKKGSTVDEGDREHPTDLSKGHVNKVGAVIADPFFLCYFHMLLVFGVTMIITEFENLFKRGCHPERR